MTPPAPSTRLPFAPSRPKAATGLAVATRKLALWCSGWRGHKTAHALLPLGLRKPAADEDGRPLRQPFRPDLNFPTFGLTNWSPRSF